VFSYIAKNENSKHECFVLLSDKLAEQITLTIGEAFDLAYERFIKNYRDVESQKQIILLQRRNTELETENRMLHEKLLKRDNPNYTPLIPNSPIPPIPVLQNLNGGLINTIQQANNSKSSSNLSSLSLSEIFNNHLNTNTVNRFQEPDEMFDNDFDPRAEERQQIEIKSGADNTKTLDDLVVLLKRVDKRFAEINESFRSGLGIGDTGDSARDLDIDEQKEGEYDDLPSTSREN